MNTNQVKKFAQEARIKLLEQVSARLSYALTADTAELREQVGQIKQLRQELERTSKEQLIEKVAYTWFNRLIALRFMDANDYQPLGIRIITPKDGYTLPEILDETKRGNIPEELRINKQRIYDILDSRIPSSNPQNEAFKELLIASCNHLHSVFPFLFEQINDYTELLLPDDLTSDFSIVTTILNGMAIEDCKDVEIIGWLYQFYISEKKDEVFASKSKVKKEDIPAATQLFTPRWIVEYMVQNTVGKLWLQNRPNSRLREHMPYFIESASQSTDDYLKIESPEEITLLDPACGSGHILIYAFELFTKIYEEEGYNTNEIPKLIIEKNLHGYEIDERAAQLSGFALMIKAREYQRRAFRKDLEPNILCFEDLHLTSDEIKDTLSSLNVQVTDDLLYDLNLFQQATNFGSLIIPQAHKSEIHQIDEKLNQFADSADVFQRSTIVALLKTINQVKLLAVKYHCVVTNPPYMGGGNMNIKLSDFVKTHYTDSKSDLMTCFMEAGLRKCHYQGLIGMINFSSWVFLSSFEKLRKLLILDKQIQTLLHNGRGVFGSDFGTVAFTIKNGLSEDKSAIFYRLFKRQVEVRSNEKLEKIFIENIRTPYIIDQNKFLHIPSYVFGYWMNENSFNIFKDSSDLKSVGLVRQGASTSNNNRFLRLWYEVDFGNIGFGLKGIEETKTGYTKWFPYNKGGDFKKWYGNEDYVINYKNDGRELKEFQSRLNQGWTVRLKSREYYFKRTISWTKIAYDFSCRHFPDGYIFDVAGCCYFPYEEKDYYRILGFLNSNTSKFFLNVLSPTVNFEIEHIKKLPKVDFSVINEDLILSCIKITKTYDHSHEISWGFKRNELIKLFGQDLTETYDLYCKYWENIFNKLVLNERELNKQYSELYGQQDELNPKVSINDVTILNEETTKIHDSLNFINQNILIQFISYSVGCMFGRYSLDKEGLILANHGEALEEYLQKVEKSEHECSFLPDDDNIIPILDHEWFEDDIVGRFYEFLRVTFGEQNFNKNLAFIEEHIGKDIRKYFIKDFYPDHIKRYKKRPIYWMFSSPKGSFNALIYLHRYTPDTISIMLNQYLKEFIGKLNTRKEHLQRVQISGSVSEQNKAIKEIDKIDKMLIEMQEYERDVLFPMATERITIDLDDGVLVNYNKFGKAVKEVSGLNDKKTKEKVRKFDWIDTTQIR